MRIERNKKKQWQLWEIHNGEVCFKDLAGNIKTELTALRMFNSNRIGNKATSCIKSINGFTFENLSGTIGGLTLVEEEESNDNQTCINE